MSKIAVLTSGGLDSSILLADLSKTSRTHPIYVRSGLRWENEELKALHNFIDSIGNSQISDIVVLSLDAQSIYGHTHWSVKGAVPNYDAPDQDVYLPGRNIILIGLATVWASLNNVDTIFLGSLKGNPFTDATDEFIKNYTDVLNSGLKNEIAIKAPYREKNKVELIQEFQHLPLDKTMTCIQPINMIHCNSCNKCKERRQAFEDAGIQDTTKYNRKAI